MSVYFDNSNILKKFRFGFNKGCGTEKAVVNVVNVLLRVSGIFYDLTKAFDLVDRRVIIQMLRGLYE